MELQCAVHRLDTRPDVCQPHTRCRRRWIEAAPIVGDAEFERRTRFWLTEAYVPEIARLDRGRFPAVADIAAHIGPCHVEPVPIPHDCADGFLAAFWRRPEAYLDPTIRAGMSGFALIDQDAAARGVERLAAALRSGEWERRFGGLRALDELDVGYRLVVT